jgi:hypothetical protein
MATRSHKEEVKVKGENKIDDTLITVTGIVISVDWDEEGNPIAAAISSSDEQEYLINPDAKGKELLAFIRKKIAAEGVVRKKKKDQKVITVKNYGLRNENGL